MADHHQEIIIVKRHGGHEEGHHGGAWKIAFADFMTAMMAFFLVLWIINATDKHTKTIIARYFNPIKMEDPARAPKGIHGDPQPESKPAEQPAKDKSPPSAQAAKEGGKGAPEASKPAAGEAHEPPDPAKPKPTMSEENLFKDPIASLNQIAGGPPAAGGQSEGAASSSAGVDAFRDPFQPGAGSPAGPAAESAGASEAPREAPQEPTKEEAAPAPNQTATSAKESPRPTREEPERARPQTETAVAADDAAAQAQAQALIEARRSQVAGAIRGELDRRLGKDGAQPGPSIEVKVTDEGLLVSLTDSLSYSMFAIGSAEPQPRLIHVMEAIAQTLRNRPGAIVLRGHTDGHPYRSATYDNWRLSSARAQMAYYMLTRAGVAERRIERVEGHADHDLKDAAHPLAAENRRIEILLREPKP